LAAIIILVSRELKNSEDPSKVIFKAIFSVPFAIGCMFLAHKMSWAGPFVIVFMGVVLSFMWTPYIADLVARPLSSAFDGGNVEVEPKPYYSIAHSKRKLGKPLEAIVEIRKQLAKFPNDFEGTLLLASIQAEDMKDLSSAEMTLNHFCEWDEAPPRQVVAAMNHIADWQLSVANDVDSARDTLNRIIEKYPDTPASNAAAQRIAHLGGTKKILLDAKDRRVVAVPTGIESAGLRESISHIVPEDVDPDKATADLVKHLEQHPLDAEAREHLAILYARHHHRLDLAAHELIQLAEQPGQPSRKIAHWLNLLADLQIHGGADFEIVRPTLEKIIELFPEMPVADLARRRLATVRLEIKGQQQGPPGKVLGDYEQNIGLKGNRSYSPRQL
jgi:tetratricopeptide (TPR) repeat protein